MKIYLLTALTMLCVSYGLAKKNHKLPLILCSSAACLCYLLWRLSAVPFRSGKAAWILGSILYLAEVFGAAAFMNFQYLFSGTYRLEKMELNQREEGGVPFVDVLICTYNEPLHLLRMTIAAAVNMEYPSQSFRVHVCDDGQREELRRLCREYEVGYISRSERHGAKAGNINHAIQKIQGELFAVLDADMIPTREFLRKTAGYFADPELAFVQTPQVYNNQDMYQYNLGRGMPNEQDFFMRDIQEARAARNAVLHVGTNAVFRREMVLELGGYPTCSISEDMAVGMLLQAAGYRSVFVNEELVYGLSATTFTEIVKQRDRWCRGNLQVLRHFHPMKIKGLTFSQKIAYLDGGMYWYDNIQKMIFLLCPLIYLLTGIPVLQCEAENLLAFFLPYLLGQILVFRVLSPGTRSVRWAHYYEVAMAPYLSLSVVKELLKRKTGFNVTAKENLQDRRIFHGEIAYPHIILLALTAAAWGAGLVRSGFGAMDPYSVLLNLGWSWYNLNGIVMALRVAWQKPMLRKTERIAVQSRQPVGIQVGSQKTSAVLLDISGLGAGIRLPEPIPGSSGMELILDLGTAKLKTEIVRMEKDFVAVQYRETTPEQMRAVAEILCQNLKAHYQYRKTKTL